MTPLQKPSPEAFTFSYRLTDWPCEDKSHGRVNAAYNGVIVPRYECRDCICAALDEFAKAQVRRAMAAMCRWCRMDDPIVTIGDRPYHDLGGGDECGTDKVACLAAEIRREFGLEKGGQGAE